MIIQISILVAILLIFIYLIYWYKYKCIDQIDKIIKNPFRQLLALSACVLLIFGLLIITGKSLIDNSDASRAFVLLYSLFSQTTSAYNPEYGTELQLYSVLVSMIGAVFFSGVLVSTITNSIICRVNNYNEGKVHYKHLKNHDIIIGVNESVVVLVRFLAASNNGKIVLVSDKSIKEVAKRIAILGSNLLDRIIIYNDYTLDYECLGNLGLGACRRLIIAGDNPLGQNDADNITILDHIKTYVHNMRNKRSALKCYVSYQDDYHLINYCRNETSTQINIIPFNFYASWVSRIWGYGQLCNVLPTRNKGEELQEHPNEYIPLTAFPGSEYALQIVILGYSICAEEIVKGILLLAHFACYDEKNGYGRTRITLINNQQNMVDRFRYKYNLQEIEDIDIQSVDMQEMSLASKELIAQYVELYGRKLYIVCCAESANDNIILANNLPKSVYGMQIPVLVKVDYYMQSNFPLDNKGQIVKHIKFFGMQDQYMNIDGPLNTAQAIRYIHSALRAGRNPLVHTDGCDLDKKAYAEWFGKGHLSKQVDIPKMNILSRVDFLFPIFHSLGLEICPADQADDFDMALPYDIFISMFHRQQCSYYILTGYARAQNGKTNYPTKELAFIAPCFHVQDQRLIDSYGRFREDIRYWLQANKCGLKRVDNGAN